MRNAYMVLLHIYYAAEDKHDAKAILMIADNISEDEIIAQVSLEVDGAVIKAEIMKFSDYALMTIADIAKERGLI